MIPVLICPVLNRFDLLEKMLKTVDCPVGQVVVVDNSCTGYEVPTNIIDAPVGYIRPFTGIGYGGAINAGITQTAYASWWLWASNDLTWGPGDLGFISKHMESAFRDVVARFISHGFIYGAINAAAIDKVGLVDDWEFFPIYEDDIDYYRRLKLGKVEVVHYKGGIIHGDEGVGSLTIRSDDNIKRRNSSSHSDNTLRYIAKWGGKNGAERYDTPFDSGYPLWYTKPDIRGRARRMW